MDLIYMNTDKEDVGVLKDYTLDLEFGSESNNFECAVSSNNHVCDAGFYLYYENAEYGGVIDSISFNTDSEEVIYKGRTWHGILESKILEPDKGADYLIVEGDANTVLSSLISRMGLDGLFKVSTTASSIDISYQMHRYVGGYTGIQKMLKKHGAKLYIEFKKGFVELSAKPLIDYSQDEQFDTDQITFNIQKNYKPINHVICLGKGELKNRRVIHVYADKEGNISGTQTLTGMDEVSATYENANVESDDELSQGGIDIINASWSADTVDFSFDSDKETFDVGDIIGAVERTTGAEVRAYITKKIVNISKGTTSIQYGCNASAGASSGGFPSSGGGGESGGTITVDSELSDTSENPVQNKVVTKVLEGKVGTTVFEDALNQMVKTQSGRYDFTITKTETTHTITFPEAFTETPQVTFSVYRYGYTNCTDAVLHHIGKSSFSFTVMTDNVSGGTECYVSWIATGGTVGASGVLNSYTKEETDNKFSGVQSELEAISTYKGHLNLSGDTFTGNLVIYDVGFVKMLYANNIRLANALAPASTIVLATIENEKYRPGLISISHTFPVVANGGLIGRIQIATNGQIRFTNLSTETFRTDSPIHLNAVFI